VKPDKPGAVYAERCCDTTTYFNDAGQPAFSQTFCQVCQYSGGGGLVDCTTVNKSGNPGGLNPPPSAGLLNKEPTSTAPGNNTGVLPPGSIIKIPLGSINTFSPSGNNTGNATKPVPSVPSGLEVLGSTLTKPKGNATLLPHFPSGNTTGTLPAQTITKEHNPASPNVLSLAGNATNNTGTTSPTTGLGGQHHHHKGGQASTSSSSNTNSTGH
jgi:hypothetical protein